MGDFQSEICSGEIFDSIGSVGVETFILIEMDLCRKIFGSVVKHASDGFIAGGEVKEIALEEVVGTGLVFTVYYSSDF